MKREKRPKGSRSQQIEREKVPFDLQRKNTDELKLKNAKAQKLGMSPVLKRKPVKHEENYLKYLEVSYSFQEQVYYIGYWIVKLIIQGETLGK